MDGELYYHAADIIKKVKEKRGTVKTLIYASGFQNLRQMFALVNECLKYLALLEEIASECPIQFHNETALKGSHEVAVVLLYEYLLGRKFGRAVGFRKLLQQYKDDVKLAVDRVLHKHGATNLKEVQFTSRMAAIPTIPRYMRVNLIKSTVESAIESLKSEGWEFIGKFNQDEFSTKALSLSQWQFGLDPILPDLLVFRPGTDLHDHSMTTTGVLVQQDRASCIPALALRPTPGSTVIDCCAAPGNKTSHLASVLRDNGRVIALDRDFKRLGTMTRLLGNSGATCVELIHQDFLTVEPDSEDAAEVQFMLVDPSCSGSGMLNSQTNSISTDIDKGRVQTLKRFQISILKHALRFPNTQRVVYSTCSVHQEENEEVAEEVMSQVSNQFRFTKIFPDWRGSRGLDDFPHADFFLRLSPKEDLTQGFFVACFERIMQAENETEDVKTELTKGQEKRPGKKVKKRKSEYSHNEQTDSQQDLSDLAGQQPTKKKKIKEDSTDCLVSGASQEIRKKTKRNKRRKKKELNELTHFQESTIF